MKRAQSFIGDLISTYLSEASQQSLGANEEEKKGVEDSSAAKIPTTPGAKILVVTHGGFIMEYMNAIKLLGGKQPMFNNGAKNTAIFIVKIQLKKKKSKTGTVVKPSVQIVLENDNSHLSKQ